nr:psbA-trnH [Tinospora sinensis]
MENVKNAYVNKILLTPTEGKEQYPPPSPGRTKDWVLLLQLQRLVYTKTEILAICRWGFNSS